MNVEKKIEKFVKLRDKGSLIIGGAEYSLLDIDDIYVIGAGKGVAYMGRALERVLGNRVRGGIIVEKSRQGMKLERVEVFEASHPIPDERGHEAAKAILELARQVTSRDLVFMCITGGASALLPYPVEGVTLEDLKKLQIFS